MRLIENLKHAVNNECVNTKTYCEAFEIKRARFLWIKENQKILKKQSNYTQLKQRLNIHEDSDEILRSGGRMKNALVIPYETRAPIVISSEHHLASLIVSYCHLQIMHNEVKQ